MPQFPYLVSDLLYDIVEGLNYCFVHTILKEIQSITLLEVRTSPQIEEVGRFNQ